jgi:hypothetical protein
MARKLQSPKRLKMTTWQAMSRFVRARDNYKCVTCGGVGGEAGHYQHNSERNQSLGGNALWFDARNVHAQCTHCNKFLSSNPEPYALYLEQKYGFGILQELNALYQTGKKWTRAELEEKRKSFTEAYEQLAFHGLGVVREGVVR